MPGKIGHHSDAIHRAGRQAQLAAVALAHDDGMHEFARAEDGVHRTDIETLATADADGFVDDGAGTRFVNAKTRVERFVGGVK